MKKNHSFNRWDPDKLILLIVVLAFIERIILFLYTGSGVTNDSDDVAYIQSGITFANSGVISVWSVYPTAKIMPGMPVLAGIFSLIFGEGTLYIDAVRIFWSMLGCTTIYVFYKCCCFHIPKWYALLASCSFLLINWAWSDTTFLTEPPYLLFYMLTLYFTFRLGETKEGETDIKALVGYPLSFMGALMFRANIVTMPLFGIIYLKFVKKRKLKNYIRHALALCAAILLFVIPWSIRNYEVFGEFIPLTNGTANPMLLGTYQGSTAPKDEELNYETNVYAVLRAEHPEWYNEDGSIKDMSDGEKIKDEADRVMARYRLKEWFRRDPKGCIWAYLVSKPACMLNWVWYWLPIMSIYYVLQGISMVNLALCVLAFVLAFVMKRKRRIVLFLSLMYWFNIYSFAFSFASERYAAMVVPLRYMVATIGVYLAVELLKTVKKGKEK